MLKNKNCIISEVTFKGKEVPPIIAYFENGDLKPEVMHEADCRIYRDGEKYVVAVSTRNNLLYMGKEPSQEPNRTLLAIQESDSNKVRLLEVDHVSLHPVLGKSEQQSSLDLSQTTYSDLNKTFGSKKMKIRTEQKERMQIKIETITDRLEKTVSGVSVENELPSIDPNEYSGVFIPCNRNASTIQDVYKLEDIISPEEFNSLEQTAEAALSNSPEVNAQWYSPFFCENLKILPVDEQLHRVKILLYAECLVRFLKLSYTDLQRKGCVICPFSVTINNKVLETYTVKTAKGRSRPTSMKDRVICCIIVLCLIAHKFTFNLESLQMVTKSSTKRLLELARAVGTVSSGRNKNDIALKLPLPQINAPMLKKKKPKRN